MAHNQPASAGYKLREVKEKNDICTSKYVFLHFVGIGERARVMLDEFRPRCCGTCHAHMLRVPRPVDGILDQGAQGGAA